MHLLNDFDPCCDTGVSGCGGCLHELAKPATRFSIPVMVIAAMSKRDQDQQQHQDAEHGNALLVLPETRPVNR